MNRTLRVVLFVLCSLVFLRPATGQIGVTVTFGPPALPVYELPPCPGDGYYWTPGYWAWDPDYGYYWVPGTWVLTPQAGLLWTPAWWGWEGSGFIFHEGFWAREIGFYGGIDYGFGYFGTGFVGGRWDGGVFRYNTAVLNVNTTIIHNTYVDRTVIVNRTENHISYNGGQGGITARPTPEQERVLQGQHIPPVAAQQQHVQAARTNPALRASENQGKPSIAATSRPGEFTGRTIVAARAAGAPYHAPPTTQNREARQPTSENNHPGEQPHETSPTHAGEAPHETNPTHPGEAPRETSPTHAGEASHETNATHGSEAPHETNPAHASDLHPHQVTAPNTGNSKLDQKHQQEQQNLVDKQNKEHQQLAQKQEQEHRTAQQHNYSQDKQKQMESKHQQQTQQMVQKHDQQMQQLKTKQTPERPK